MNELLRVPFDFCHPTIRVQLEKVPCVDEKGRDNHILLMHVEPSSEIHANQADEVYFRVGDKSKLLKFEERLQLSYDKGERYFEDKPVPDAVVNDIDLNLVRGYAEKIGYSKSPMEYLTQNKGFVREKMEKYLLAQLQFYCLEKIRSSFSHERECVLFDMRVLKKNLGLK